MQPLLYFPGHPNRTEPSQQFLAYAAHKSSCHIALQRDVLQEARNTLRVLLSIKAALNLPNPTHIPQHAVRNSNGNGKSGEQSEQAILS